MLITVYIKLLIISMISRVSAVLSIDLLLCDKTFAIIKTILYKKIVFCALFDLEIHENAVDLALLKYNKPVQVYDFEKMMQIIEECTKLSFQMHPFSSEKYNGNLPNITEIRSLWNGIIPGTKWCGYGDNAKNYHDLGTLTYFDICCRAHDHCPSRIKPFQFSYGVINLSLYTKSHCKCDELFYKCLHLVNSSLSNLVGNFYFNIMNFDCFIFINQTCTHGLGCKKFTQKVKFVPNESIY